MVAANEHPGYIRPVIRLSQRSGPILFIMYNMLFTGLGYGVKWSFRGDCCALSSLSGEVIHVSVYIQLR